jgi:peptidoglycan/LPS O-acetylase OafA/YrhL
MQPSNQGEDCEITRPKIETLTSLRFFAAAMIVVYHTQIAFGYTNNFTKNIALGSGVSFFFVLSGFILSYNYRSFTSNHEKISFLIARFARLWPAHLMTFVLVMLIDPAASNYWANKSPIWVTLCNIFMIHSWIPIWDSFFSWNAVSWSISTELFFYIIFIFIAGKIRQSTFLIVVVSALITLMLIVACNVLKLPYNEWSHGVNVQGLIYISPISRLFEFIIGMATAVLMDRHNKNKCKNIFSNTLFEIIAIVLCLLSIYYLPRLAWLNTSVYNFIGHAGATWATSSASAPAWAILIWIFATRQGMMGKLLVTRPLILLGEISYSVSGVSG